MKYFKIFLITLIISFLGLFFAYQNGLNERWNNERKNLTEAMIKEYENDLKNGVDVTKKEYVVVKPTYSNKYSSTLLKVSKKIEKGIDNVIKYFFKKINDMVDD